MELAHSGRLKGIINVSLDTLVLPSSSYSISIDESTLYTSGFFTSISHTSADVAGGVSVTMEPAGITFLVSEFEYVNNVTLSFPAMFVGSFGPTSVNPFMFDVGLNLYIFEAS